MKRLVQGDADERSAFPDTTHESLRLGVAFQRQFHLAGGFIINFAVNVGRQRRVIELCHGVISHRLSRQLQPGTASTAPDIPPTRRWSAALARLRRLVTVPIGTSRISDASLYEYPSTQTSMTTARYSSDNVLMAFLTAASVKQFSASLAPSKLASDTVSTVCKWRARRASERIWSM